MQKIISIRAPTLGINLVNIFVVAFDVIMPSRHYFDTDLISTTTQTVSVEINTQATLDDGRYTLSHTISIIPRITRKIIKGTINSYQTCA